MKYSFKDYLIDTLMFGLSVSITPIIYLSTFIIVNKFNYINSPVNLYLAIFISFCYRLYSAFFFQENFANNLYFHI